MDYAAAPDVATPVRTMPWVLLVIGIGMLDFWGSRYNLNPDGISYLEMAGNALSQGPGALVNGYWSPAYPLLLVPVRLLAPAAWTSAIPALHLVNFAIYLLAAAIFCSLLRLASRGAPGAALSMPFGSAAFVVIAVQCIGLGLLTPDFVVMLMVLCTAGCCLQLERTDRPTRWSALLGVALAAGYWTKGILLPLNAGLLVLLFIFPPRIARARAMVARAATVFGLLSLPLVVLVSAKVGRASAGEVGRLNYAWEIDDMASPFVGWVGDPGNVYGTPLHPPRVLQESPRVLEFATPIRASYPLWFDPSYWYAGLKPRFSLAGHRRALAQGLADLGDVLIDQWAVIAGLLLIWLTTTREARDEKREANGMQHSRMPFVFALWSAAAALLYASVHLESRYLAGFVAVAVVAAWQPLTRRVPRRALPFAVAASVIALLVSLALNLEKNIGGFERSYRPDYLLDAKKLAAAGLRRGDAIAMIGDAHEAYAAFANGAWVAAQVFDSTGFWQLTPAAREALQERLGAMGIRALLANNVGGEMAADGWLIFGRPDSSNIAVRRVGPQ